MAKRLRTEPGLTRLSAIRNRTRTPGRSRDAMANYKSRFGTPNVTPVDLLPLWLREVDLESVAKASRQQVSTWLNTIAALPRKQRAQIVANPSVQTIAARARKIGLTFRVSIPIVEPT